MPTSPSSSAQQARQALADQLREIRQDAGLTGRALAGAAGWRVEKVSRIEHGTRSLSADDLRTWCEVCEVPSERTEELLAEQRAVVGMWTSYKRLHRAGLRQAQTAVRPVYERATLLRSYVPDVFPGLLQTAGYTSAALTTVRDDLSLTVDDVAEAVAERMDRQTVLRSGRRRFVFLIEEQVLLHRTVPVEVHAGQLHHLLAVMSLPSVSVGIVPTATPRLGVWPVEAFTAFDEELVAVELVSGVLNVTQPGEIALYLRAFTAMSALAVRGNSARVLIEAALSALEEEYVATSGNLVDLQDGGP